MPSLALNPDRLLPSGRTERRIARELYEAVRDLPITSPHGHVPARWLAEDAAFEDPTSLLLTPDHYVTRLLHAQGVSLADLGVGVDTFSAQQKRNAFRLLCAHWKAYRGTAVKTWLEAQLVEVFGVDVAPSAATADEVYDAIAERLNDPTFRPRALYERFGIDVLATTDDPCDDLRHHRALLDDPDWRGRVVPTFRPDKYLEPAAADWNRHVDTLAVSADVDTGTLAGWVAAMVSRRAYFRAHGAVSSDHSHVDVRMEPMEPMEAERLYCAARKGEITPAEADALRRHLLFEQARMAADDGMVMTLHPGVCRDHHSATAQ
ncbi:glucuronate isomerase, partial [Kineococcus arenarius]|uniref:glucuronate isomerase n=1 Tax=unclassified Kineococcus TaxID=2621656 RepID=UPI003D7DF4F3